MPIQNVVSTLPDQQWVAAVEKEFAALRAEIETLKLNQREISSRR